MPAHTDGRGRSVRGVDRANAVKPQPESHAGGSLRAAVQLRSDLVHCMHGGVFCQPLRQICGSEPSQCRFAISRQRVSYPVCPIYNSWKCCKF